MRKVTGKTYSKSGMLALVSRMGYSARSPRPVPYNSATPEEQAKFRSEIKQEIDKYRQEGYHICCFDACGITNAPAARRGIRTRGGTDTVDANSSKKRIQMLGLLGVDTLDMMFSNAYKSGDTIRMFKHTREKHEKIYCLMDNACANKSNDVKKYLTETGSDAS